VEGRTSTVGGCWREGTAAHGPEPVSGNRTVSALFCGFQGGRLAVIVHSDWCAPQRLAIFQKLLTFQSRNCQLLIPCRPSVRWSSAHICLTVLLSPMFLKSNSRSP
jgi:hypothetical protein